MVGIAALPPNCSIDEIIEFPHKDDVAIVDGFV